MKNLIKLSVLFVLLAYFSSCKVDPPTGGVSDASFNALKSYMKSNNLDLPTLLSQPVSWVVEGSTIVNTGDFTIPDYKIYDVRPAADFKNGHIKGAENITLANLVKDAKTENLKDKKILVVCFTGQTAAYGTMALRLAGFAKAQTLKWGMAAWNEKFKGPWIANSGYEIPANGNLASGHANWVKTAPPANGSFGNPTWTSGSTGDALLQERIQAVLDAGFGMADAKAVLENPANYLIYNYWSEADYTGYGHYTGAFNVPTISLDNLSVFDPSKEFLLYCYTGQTSGFASFWLNVLGYKAKSIGFAGNRLVYDQIKTKPGVFYKGYQTYQYITE